MPSIFFPIAIALLASTAIHALPVDLAEADSCGSFGGCRALRPDTHLVQPESMSLEPVPITYQPGDVRVNPPAIWTHSRLQTVGEAQHEIVGEGFLTTDACPQFRLVGEGHRVCYNPMRPEYRPSYSSLGNENEQEEGGEEYTKIPSEDVRDIRRTLLRERLARVRHGLPFMRDEERFSTFNARPVVRVNIAGIAHAGGELKNFA